MSLMTRALSLLREPRLRAVDVDGPELISAHRAILADKPMLRRVFRELYDLCMRLDARHFAGDGLRLEIGAGVSAMKTFYPEVICTDIKPAPHLDRVLDAEAMDLADASVRAIFGLNCFHHFAHPERFFAELARVLVPGGGCVLVEPYYGPVARRFYAHLFATEHFDARAGWHTAAHAGAMTGANQALSYIVFVRDAARFAEVAPNLEIVERRPLGSYVRYLASGGLNFRPLVPAFTGGALAGLELLLSPLARWLALHHVVVLRRR